MPPESTTLRAKFVATMDGPVLHDASVTLRDGRIVAIGAERGSHVQDLGDVVLMPGLVNAHVHLELSLLKPQQNFSGSFCEWLLTMPRQSTPERVVRLAVNEGVLRSLHSGVTSLADISQQAHITRDELSKIDRPPRVVSYGEVLGLAKRRYRFDELLNAATQRSSHHLIGISPHAPYTVDRPGYEQCLRIARERQLPLATHL